MDSSPDLSLQLRRNSRGSDSYMDFAQGIDSDIEETPSTNQKPTSNSSSEINPRDSITSSLLQTMDPPSPILPPPPGSISPPRFLNEDFDVEDDDEAGNASLPVVNLADTSSLLIEPPSPPPPAMISSRSNTVEEASAAEDEDEDDEQQTIIQNKLKGHSMDEDNFRNSTGLDSLTSDMAAKLQSMISEEIEETIPKDTEEEQHEEWTRSPPAPAWRNEMESMQTTTMTTTVVTSTGGGGGSLDEEDEDESSGNSQSPPQVHKIISPPPPLPEEENEKW